MSENDQAPLFGPKAGYLIAGAVIGMTVLVAVGLAWTFVTPVNPLDFLPFSPANSPEIGIHQIANNTYEVQVSTFHFTLITPIPLGLKEGVCYQVVFNSLEDVIQYHSMTLSFEPSVYAC